MKGLIKTIFISLACVLLVAGTFMLDEKISAVDLEEELDKVEVIEKGPDSLFKNENGVYFFDAGRESRMSVLFNGNALLRLAPGSKANVSLSKSFPRKGQLELTGGRFWINTLNSSLNFEIKTPSLAIEAEPGVFDIQYGNELVVLVALRRSLEVVFLGSRLLIPELRQMTISEKKLRQQADLISKLTYSKLLKEFSYFAAEKPDKWILINQEDDKKFFDDFREKKYQKIRDQGPKVGSNKDSVFFKLDEAVKKAGLELTFDPAKQNKRLAKIIFDYFDSAVFAALIGKEDLKKAWLAEFKNQTDRIIGFDEFFMKKFDDFAFVAPSDSLFEIKTTLQNLAVKDVLAVSRTAFNNVLDVAAAGNDVTTQAKVTAALRNFGSLADKSIARISSANAADEIFFESVRINDFLDRNPEMFLREEFLKTSEIFEKAYLNLVASRAEADDQRQFLISEKLKKVGVLKALMEKEEMPYNESRAALLLIAGQIDSLKPIFSDTAVLAYFDEQLKQLAPLLAFLRANTPSNMRGSFKDNFKDFQSRTREMQQIMELLATSTGGAQITAAKREEIASIVMNDLGGIGAVGIKITLPETEDDPRVNVISASFSGANFIGIYDTDKKIMSDITFNNEKISNAIRLENLKKFFNVKLGKEKLESGTTAESLTQQPKQLSALEKVIKAKLLEELGKQEISVEEKYIDFADLAIGIAHIELAGAEDKFFSFDISDDLSLVSNLKVSTIDGDIPVNGKFSLKELSSRVAQVYKNIEFGKMKEEELKGLE
ncbi:FecR domain-containing protein [Candidatus Peregrinibacteria bacterium]|nr:FecR domain-containing protein [Candidatus Peregrinibacteria bacterium]